MASGAATATPALASATARPPPPRESWLRRAQQTLASYLPLLLMLMLALGTWWLVKHSPQPDGPRDDTTVRQEPDYTMSGFAIERFGADGRLVLRLEGAQLHHYPATDRIEIEAVRVQAFAPDGGLTLATARQALATSDGSEVQLLGGAEVRRTGGGQPPLVMRGEFLHAFFVTERITSNRPVVVTQGGTELRAAGLVYDHPSGRLDLGGPTRITLQPQTMQRTR